jgi:formylmethanofuran dehydrogenase subunit C
MRQKKEKKPPLGLDETFTDKINAASADEIKAEMILIQKGVEEAKDFKKNKAEISDAREALKTMLGPINDTIKASNNKLKYMIERLKQMGAL